MIEKFKKGGTKKQGSILAQIQQLPKQQQEQVLQAFSQWAQQKGIDINQLQQDQNALEEALGMFMQELQGAQAQKARQGAKLNYIKTLKNQCAEDEEVVYYKRGGSVGCGCKKKEDGGEINKAQKGTTVENFKKSKKKTVNINPNDTIHVNGGIRDLTQANSPEKSDKKNVGPTGYQRLSKEEYRKMPYKDKARVDEKDEAANRKKSGGVVSKFKAAKCGTKMKKHQNGGSLNGVPFYQTGTPEGGIVLNNDATYVAPVKAFNPETMYFEPTQESWEDLIPIYGSYREAKKMDENPSFKQGVALGTSVLSDALSLGLANTAVKTLLRGPKYAKILKARGFKPITTDGRTVMKTGLKQVPIQAGKYGTIGHKTEPYIIVKQIPNTNPFTTFIKGLRPNGVDVAGATAAGALGWGAGEYKANQKK